MPLAFDSISHGSVAFGFFNIDSDMLLLDRYFFFAPEFCDYVSGISDSDLDGDYKNHWQVYHIADQQDIGDLMGAIHGIRHVGFIGDSYRRFPFPEKPEDFKQKPEGFKNRAIMEAMIEKYTGLTRIPFTALKEVREISIGAYIFSRASFQDLIKYVWRGGYPRWRDETRPDYVMAMKRKIEQGKHWLFDGFVLKEE